MKRYDTITAISYPKKGAMGKTGTWRVFRPKLDKDKCIKCLKCWLYCPEGAIIRNPDNSVDINYDYCKGCGICASVCPEKIGAIVMEREEKK